MTTTATLVRSLVGMILLTNCAAEDESSDYGRPGMFQIEPGLWVSTIDEGKADLPNFDLQPRYLDTHSYRVIAKQWADTGRDMNVIGQPVLDWPLADSRSVLSRSGTPIRLGRDVYEHTGLDIIRENDEQSAVVSSPLTGTARISDWSGTQVYPQGDYSTVVSIWDPQTHVVVQLMHVQPDPAFPHDGTEFAVERGQVLGELAEINIRGGRHTHVTVVDQPNHLLLDPVPAFPTYIDNVPPVGEEIYALDANANRVTAISDGAFDIVVTTFDRDERSNRNLEPSSAAFTVKDQNGRVLSQIGRCTFSEAFSLLAPGRFYGSTTIGLIDFGNAVEQVKGFWPGSDMGNPDRKFRYALTNLILDDLGCGVVAHDREGQIQITPDIEYIDVHVDLWDSRGNHSSTQSRITRSAQE